MHMKVFVYVFACMLSFSLHGLRISGADIIVITECDTFHPVFGSYHLIQWLAKSLDMFSIHSDIIHTTG